MVLYVELTHLFITIYYWHTEESRQVKFSLMYFFPWKEIMFHSPSGTFHMSGFFMGNLEFFNMPPRIFVQNHFSCPRFEIERDGSEGVKKTRAMFPC